MPHSDWLSPLGVVLHVVESRMRALIAARILGAIRRILAQKCDHLGGLVESFVNHVTKKFSCADGEDLWESLNAENPY